MCAYNYTIIYTNNTFTVLISDAIPYKVSICITLKYELFNFVYKSVNLLVTVEVYSHIYVTIDKSK